MCLDIELLSVLLLIMPIAKGAMFWAVQPRTQHMFLVTSRHSLASVPSINDQVHCSAVALMSPLLPVIV